MAVRIRLFRRGRKKMAMYDIVVADARAPRDGKFIEKLGNYNPNTDPATIVLNTESAFNWVMDGAQPTDTARTILSRKGVMLRKHLQVGVNKGAITQEEADKRYADWLNTKEGKESAIIEGLAQVKADDAKTRFAAETKVKEARAEALAKKQSELIAAEEAAAKAAEAEASGEDEEAPEAAAETETPAEEAPVAEEAAAEVEAAPAEEAPAVEEKAPEAEVAAEEAAPKVEEPKAEATEEAAPKAEKPKAEATEEAAPKAEEPKAEATEEAAPEAKEEEKKED